MNKITSVEEFTNPYTKRILGNILNQDPMAVLKSTPKRLAKAAKGLTKKQMSTPPAPGKWTIAQIISHFCDAELTMSYRIRMAVAQSGANIQAYDENKWADALRYTGGDVHQKLETFIANRSMNVWLLSSLSSEELERFGIHEERGKETVERMAHMLAGHDVNHVKQVEHIRSLVAVKRKASPKRKSTRRKK
ncbi:MAG TPA: DinB family protein [Bacteroidota bacterium]|nr:DinB family protein [Bacteroidota bacterium]